MRTDRLYPLLILAVSLAYVGLCVYGYVAG